MLIVDGLEMIDIDDRHGARGLLCARQQRLQDAQHRAPIRHAGELVGHRERAHAHGGAPLLECQEQQHQGEHHDQHDDDRLQLTYTILLREGFLVCLVLPQQQFVLLLLGSRVELDTQGREALIDLIAKLSLGGFGSLCQKSVACAPVAHRRMHRCELGIRGMQFAQRRGLPEHLKRIFERRHALRQLLQLMKCYPACEIDLGLQSRIGGVLLQRFGPLQDLQGSTRIPFAILHGSKPTQGVCLTPRVCDLTIDLQRLIERLASVVPFPEILVRATQVVQRDRLFTQKARRTLSFERLGVHVTRLCEIAHTVVENGDPVDGGERVLRQTLLVVEDLRTLEIRQPRGVLPFQPHQISAREQGGGEHFIVARLSRDRNSIDIELFGLLIVADGFGHLAFARQHAGA